jgi:hypothetical protein
MNRLLQAIAAATLIGCYALPALAEEPPKFADHKVKVYTGKRAKPCLDHEFWRDRSETYRGAMEDDKVNGRPLRRRHPALRLGMPGADIPRRPLRAHHPVLHHLQLGRSAR